MTEAGPIVRRLTENPNFVLPLRGNEYFLARKSCDNTPAGFAGYLFFERPAGSVPRNSFQLEQDLSYLSDGDIVRLDPGRGTLRTLYRRHSAHNAILLTEQCNNYCLMCSQPPKAIDDSHLADEALRTIPLMAPETACIGITGGEPTLLRQRLLKVIQSLKCHLPSTAVHLLSNGRAFKEWEYANAIAQIHHPDLMIGIPLYSDISSIHDFVVQAHGAYDDTVRGILNLKSVATKVEIRVVLHKSTYERLPELARFIRRNLTFCERVAFMGLEIAGFTKGNLDILWIDPHEYQRELREAVEILDRGRMAVSIYNHQLCILDPELARFSRKSISDWKNELMPECTKCVRKSDCGGFFSSAKLRYSSHIRAFSD